MSKRGGWEAWGAAAASAACVVRGVRAVLSGKCASALCLLLDGDRASGRHAPSGGHRAGQEGGVPKEMKDGLGRGSSCSVNSVAVGALYAHLQWCVWGLVFV